MDGIEEALRENDDLALSRFLAPDLLAKMAESTSSMSRSGGVFNPARSGLRWSESRRRPGGPGRCWLRLRFEDLTTCRYPEGLSPRLHGHTRWRSRSRLWVPRGGCAGWWSYSVTARFRAASGGAQMSSKHQG